MRCGRIAYDGVGGALDHPRVWLEMGDDPHVECTYCDCRFVMVGASGAKAGRKAAGVYESSHDH